MENQWIYLDNNSTTRTDPRVVEAMLPYLTEEYANAGSSHLFGTLIADAIDNAQWQVAELIGAKPNEILFTSGATESVNLAIKGLRHHPKKHIVAVTTEHKAVLDVCSQMTKNGFTVSYIGVQPNGLLDFQEIQSTITDDTLLVCVMLANNETGVIQPIAEIAAIAHAKGAFILCDATQAVGKIPVDVIDLDIDLMPFSAHKFYGPKGIGALYISAKAKLQLEAQIHGGGQQKNRRSGTLNVPGIVALGKASEIAKSEMDADAVRIGTLRNQLENDLLQIPNTSVNGGPQHRLYNTSNICFRGIDSEELIRRLQNIAVSSGSACSAVSVEPSHVLKEMGLSDDDALASIRFSLGRFTTAEEINFVVNRVRDLVGELRQQ